MACISANDQHTGDSSHDNKTRNTYRSVNIGQEDTELSLVQRIEYYMRKTSEKQLKMNLFHKMDRYTSNMQYPIDFL